jgi:CheY-like chemotaxis protein
LWGHEVYACRTGREALEIAATYRPDAALVDIVLPGMDGFELAYRLRKHPDLLGMTLIAVTVLGDRPSRQLSREAGLAYHLLKPVAPGELRETLAAVAETKHLSLLR